ncbi:MAG: carboxypeptidase regulatory-like domain-containing protein [Acidobacteriaceae bacterium]|nr:carboxypeptidase regulatory-like domain-containing protein [Acidobacteriaceae bacterium]
MKTIALVLATGAMLLSQTPQEDTVSGSIRGRVINAITGEPLKNVPVRISGDKTELTAVSRPDGQFIAENLQPGIIHVSAQSPQFPGMLGINLDSASIALKRGEDRADVVLKLTPGGAISGTVRNDRNEPVQSCSVGADSVMPSPIPQENEIRSSAHTNDKGEYRIDLAAGRYFVAVKCSESIALKRPLSQDWDEPQESWLPVFYPDNPEPSGRASITVRPSSEASGIDFHLRKTRVGSVRGSIKYPPSAHASLLEAELIPKGSAPNEDHWALSQSIQADSRDLHMQYIPPGLYTLWIVTTSDPPERYLYGSLDVEVESGRTQTVSVEMRPGIVVHGSVVSQIHSENQSHAASEKRSIYFERERARASRFAEIQDDETFTVAGLDPGTWSVSLAGPDHSRVVQSIAWGGHEIEGNKIVISADQTRPMRILVGPSNGGVVTGSVQNTAAAAGSDSESFQRPLRAHVYPVRDGQIDPARTPIHVVLRGGQFHADHVSSGEYFAFAIDENIHDVRPIANLLAPQAETFLVQDGATQTVAIPVLSRDQILQAALQYLEGSSGPR